MRIVFFLFFLITVNLSATEHVSIQMNWKFQYEFAGYIAAKEKGFYKEVGLDVDLLPYRDGIDVVQEIMDGKSDFGIYSSPIAVKNGKSLPIVLAATYLQHSPLVFVTQPSIYKPSELTGKTIMGTTSELTNSSLSFLLYHFGIDESNARFVPHTYTIEPFVRKEVDVMSAYRSNELYELDRERVKYNIIDPAEYGFLINDGNLFVSVNTVQTNPRKVRRLLEATNKGWAYALQHPDEMISLLRTKYGCTKSPEALRYEYKVIKRLMMTDLYRIGEVTPELTQRLFKQLIRAGKIDPNQKLQTMTLDQIDLEPNRFMLSAEEKSFLEHKGKVTMCVDPEWYPFEAIRKGQHIGIAADVMHDFERRIGVPIVMQPVTSWEESVEYAKARKCDIYSLASPTPERLKYMRFTTPYISLPIVVVTSMEEPYIDDIDALKGKSLGVVKGYAIGEKLRQTRPDLTIVDVKSITEGLQKVENGELYGYVDNLMVCSSYLQREYTGVLKVSARLNENVDLGVGVRNDEPLLFSVFQKCVSDLDEATMQSIYNRWSSTIEQVAWIDQGTLIKAFIVALMVMIALFWRYRVLKKYNVRLLELSVTDKLTRLYNRQKTDEKLNEEKHKVDRYADQYQCSIMMIDIDYFKTINDTLGHQIGDKVLVAIAELMNRTFRQTDIIGRWGGEEFMIILPHTTYAEALKVAENVRLKVMEHPFNVGIPLTISVGVGRLRVHESVHETIARVDGALYKAKENGRNCVIGTF